MPKSIVAPKRDLPTHVESYNPAEEYLLDDQELKEWQEKDEFDRKTNYVPQKFDALRKVPLYQDLIREHFERCLDLYMCPRLMRKKVSVQDMSKLIPELPSPQDLKPFPIQVSIDYHFHTSCVRSLAVHPNGMWLASGDEEGNLVIWSTKSSKIVRKYRLANKVSDKVAWCPNEEYSLLLVANEETVHLITPNLGTNEVNKATSDLIEDSKKTY